jgi:2-polyprenyl-3-methyl-5-hydroxy-6-metoxy-1,4-benzoquinol methylase
MHVLHAEIQPPDIGGGPLGARSKAANYAKRTVRKLTSWYVEPRWVSQRLYDAHNAQFASGVDAELQRLDRELDRLRRTNNTLRLQVVSSLERINRMRAHLEEFTTGTAEREKEFIVSMGEFLRAAASEDDLQLLRQEVAGVLQRLGAASSAGASIDYVAFEDRFRGSGDALRQTQRHYVTVFPPPEIPGRILDAGCGRGEMLELLRDAGHEVLGVDSDSDMIQVCRDKGLPVVEDNAIHQLEWLPDESLKGIFCAQVVEHLLTSELEQFIRLAERKLQPGGVLVVETINPRSLFAIGNHFYADLSHVRPVHPETLRFICEQVGFSAVQLEELSPHPMIENTADLPTDTVGTAVDSLLRSVFGHQDYAIVATK